MDSINAPPTVDPLAAARWHSLPRTQAPWLHEEVGRRMAERLAWIKLQPKAWLHWHPDLGGKQTQQRVQDYYPKSKVFSQKIHMGVEYSAIKSEATRWWQRLAPGRASQAQNLPDASVDMVWANMALHTAPDPAALLQHWHSVLKPDGFLMFSALGPDSLRNLRHLYADCGWPPPAPEFTDMHDWGDMLVQTGFAEPVMDMERITLEFTSPERLVAELRDVGRNLHPQRFGSLRGRQWHAELLRQIATKLKPAGSAEGKLSLQFEIVYGHALKAQPKLAVAPVTHVGLAQMQAMLRGKAGGGGTKA